MRRLAALLALVLLAALLGGTPARAQTATSVGLTLVSQSAWNAPDRPLDLTVRVTNGGAANLAGLSLALTIGAPATSRSVYELSLRSDATSPRYTFPFPEPGSIPVGADRVFAIHQDLSGLFLGSTSALFPLLVEIRSNDVPLTSLRTPMVFLTEPPTVPLSFAWTVVLSEPTQLTPGGVLGPGPVASDIAAGGRIDQLVGALDRARPVTADLVVSPTLIAELSKMAKGFRSAEAGGAPLSVHPGTGAAADAARVLAEIARVAGRPAVNLEALPFGDAQIPAVLRAGQGKYLSNLLFRGRADVQAALGVAPSTEVVRPTDSELDGPSLIQLVARGTRVVLVDPGFLPSPAQGGLTFSPPSVVRLTSGTRSAEAVIPDAGVAALAAGYPGDPQLAAHAALGELAATWLEFPGTPGRGAAMLFPEGPRYPAALAGIMANLVGASPWLHPVHASDLAAAITPQAAARVPARTYPRFDPAYIDRLRAARRSLNEFDHAVVGAEALKAALGDDLLGCLGGTFVADPAAGDRYIGAVVTAVRQTFSKLTLPASGTTVTLTSQRATLPLTIVNASAYPIHARVVLTADRRLVFGGGGTREVTIPPKGLTIQFGVSARTTGRFPMRVLVQTPGGEATIVQTQIVVRSTAYNRVALLLTIGAALFLAVWWGRRFLPRRTSA